MKKSIQNEMILASAGSGKTYRLTNRYLRLMALGAEPERIVALTFTRKAAGEFFDEILKKLARAAETPAEAAALAEGIGCPDLDSAAAAEMLATLVDRMHQLELGTLDGFFYRIVRNFPFELGLSAPPELLDENAMRMEKRRVFRHVFRTPGQSGEAARREFIEAFKQATWGSEEKRLSSKLDRFVDDHHEVYLAAPERELWGVERRIWPEGCRWLGSRVDHRRALAVLEERFQSRKLSEGQSKAWRKLFAAAEEWEPGSPWRPEFKTPLGNALKVWPDLEAGSAEYMIGRKALPLDPVECAALRDLVRCLFASELEKKLQITRGLYEILRGFESAYADLVRSGGRLTFGDILTLLAGGADQEQRPRLSQDDHGPGRLAINYRIDGHYDHWLLDEFQDTSFVQWRALSDLIDEVVQDAEGRRSFFYVGDVKQAIFAWREGDSRLFREIYDHYNWAGGPAAIVEQRMSESWRSSPAVIESVNRVFGDHEVLKTLFLSDAVIRWIDGWDPHRARHEDRQGCVRFFQAPDRESRHAAVLAVLREVDPLVRGLSCAILVQKNDQAAEILQYLRAHGEFPVAGEMDIRPGTDNPLGMALISLFKWAAYPGDTYAWEHVRMTPIWTIIEERRSSAERDSVARGILESIHRDGFACTAAEWIAQLERINVLDPFNRERGEIIVSAARAFDALGRRSVADFVEFLHDYSLHETGADGTVRVMTIHKSKGLGFDVVILPELEGERLDARRRKLAVSRTASREVEWVLDPPARQIVEHDSVLAAHDRTTGADACYERFCQLYVAMTRAKRATYLVTEPLKKSSSSANFVRWLNAALAKGDPVNVSCGDTVLELLYETGNPEWYAEFTPPPEAVTGDSERREAREYGVRERRRRGTPSRAKPRVVGAEGLFSLDSRRSLEFGSRVHEIFSRVGWWESGTVEELESMRNADAESPLMVRAFEEVLACLRASEVRAALTRPEGEVELWRERTFEVILDEEWLTGTFDRVTLVGGPEGRIQRAEIIDFKTDKGEGDLAAYTRQLAAYRRVLAFMTGLPPERILCRLLYTHRRELVTVF